MNYFIFSLKAKIKLMPILCAVLLIFMGSFYIISNSLKNSKINLDICFLENTPKNNILLSLIKGTKSTKNNLHLRTSYDLEMSKERLNKGISDVLIIIPQNFYDSILNSENKSVVISFSPYISEIEKGVFSSLSKSSMQILSYAQANIYISDSITDGFETDRNFELNKYFLNTSLNREDNFKTETLQKDDKILLIYLSLLILSTVFVNVKNKNIINLYAHLKVKGNSITKLIFIDILINVALLSFVSLISLTVLKFNFNFKFITKVFIIIFFVSSFIEFTSVFFKEGGSFLILIINIVSILSSGLVIPRLAVFKALSFTPMSLIINDSFFSFTALTIYSTILALFTILKINKLWE